MADPKRVLAEQLTGFLTEALEELEQRHMQEMLVEAAQVFLYRELGKREVRLSKADIEAFHSMTAAQGVVIERQGEDVVLHPGTMVTD